MSLNVASEVHRGSGPRSREFSALRIAGGMVRVLRPTQRRAFLVFDDRDEAGIASEPPRGLGGYCGAFFQLAAPRMVVLQRLRIHMHDDLIAVAAGQLLVASREKALGDPGESSDAPRASRWTRVRKRFRGNVFPRNRVFGRLIASGRARRPPLAAALYRERAVRFVEPPQRLVACWAASREAPGSLRLR